MESTLCALNLGTAVESLWTAMEMMCMNVHQVLCHCWDSFFLHLLRLNQSPGCKSDYDCRAKEKYCNTSVSQCVECMVNSDCQNASEECGSDNRCLVPCNEQTKCRADNECAEPNPFCNVDTSTCVVCTEQEHCSKVKTAVLERFKVYLFSLDFSGSTLQQRECLHRILWHRHRLSW